MAASDTSHSSSRDSPNRLSPGGYDEVLEGSHRTDEAFAKVPEADLRALLVKVDDANVVATDIAASNGVIHVIDQVVLPKI